MTIDRGSFGLLLLMLAGAVASGCRDAPLSVNVKTNRTPVAYAGESRSLDYNGTPVAVTLDGSGSADLDGKIVTYRWFSGTNAQDGGTGRVGPDPADVRTPTVMLDGGVWAFTLFVIDDDGGVSLPSTVTIKVGNAVTPEVMQCIDDSLPTIAVECRQCVCGLDETCRGAITACGEVCWQFYGCVQKNCGQFNDDMTALANCVRANCTEFFGGVGEYMPLVPCVSREECAETCSASVTGM